MQSAAIETASAGTKPAFTAASAFEKNYDTETSYGKLGLEELIELIYEQLHDGEDIPLDKRTKLQHILEAYDTSSNDWRRYALTDPHKSYTRNLISTDDETYTLMLLCWNPKKASPIHDHPCQGCWLRVVAGSIYEKRYREDKETKALNLVSDSTVEAGSVAFMHGNPSDDEMAYTLHLYAPPYHQCRIWLQTEDADRFLCPHVTYFSENGEIVDHEHDNDDS